MEASPLIRGHPPQRTENGPSLGNQGGVPLVLATCLFHECRRVLQSVVRVGSKAPPQACCQGGQDAQAAPSKSSKCFLYRITNATSAGFNSVIQPLKYTARGFRSFKNYRTRILFFCGKQDLKPQLQCH
jgi:hypothetical protein